MGSVTLNIGDGTARFKRSTICSSAINLLMIFSIVTTNLFAIYAFSARSQANTPTQPLHSNKVSLVSQHLSLLLRDIDTSQRQLSQMEKELIGYESFDFLHTDNIVPGELKVFLQHHQLPLGKDSRTGITDMVSSIGHSCDKSLDLLSQYMSYDVFEECPDDLSLAQKLISNGCEPLPRRRCLAVFNESRPVSNINFKEKSGFLIDDVLGLGDGNIRIGFDVSGVSGTFAARMAEKNVNIIVNTLNRDGFARGIFPLFMSMDQRFPFYDNVFDLIHASNEMDLVSSKPEKLEFLMFDLDRILKPGGLFWLDNLFCGNDGKKRELTRLIERFGYKKLKWVVGEKGDAEIYLSAVLQKPTRI